MMCFVWECYYGGGFSVKCTNLWDDRNDHLSWRALDSCGVHVDNKARATQLLPIINKWPPS